MLLKFISLLRYYILEKLPRQMNSTEWYPHLQLEPNNNVKRRFERRMIQC